MVQARPKHLTNRLPLVLLHSTDVDALEGEANDHIRDGYQVLDFSAIPGKYTMVLVLPGVAARSGEAFVELAPEPPARARSPRPAARQPRGPVPSRLPGRAGGGAPRRGRRPSPPPAEPEYDDPEYDEDRDTDYDDPEGGESAYDDRREEYPPEG